MISFGRNVLKENKYLYRMKKNHYFHIKNNKIKIFGKKIT